MTSSGGERLGLSEARDLLGHQVAFNAHGGQWVTGELVGIADRPQLMVRRADGMVEHYTLDTVDGWCASPKGRPVTDTTMDDLVCDQHGDQRETA